MNHKCIAMWYEVLGIEFPYRSSSPWMDKYGRSVEYFYCPVCNNWGCFVLDELYCDDCGTIFNYYVNDHGSWITVADWKEKIALQW